MMHESIWDGWPEPHANAIKSLMDKWRKKKPKREKDDDHTGGEESVPEAREPLTDEIFP
jgi:hypothetical protein